MKQLKKAVVLVMLTVMMAFAVQKDAEANTTTPELLVMNNSYSFDLNETSVNYNLVLETSGTVTFSVNLTKVRIAGGGITVRDISDETIKTWELHNEGSTTCSVELLAGTYTVRVWTYNRNTWGGMTGSFTPPARMLVTKPP